MGLRVVVSDKLRVQGLTEVHASEMRKRLTVTNPKWRSAVLHSGYAPQYIQIPRYITMYGDAGSALSIPRGMTLPAAYKVTQDDTVSAPVKFPKPVIELKTHQQAAYDYFVSNKGLRPFGTFLNVMEVSAGKTILSAMIARHLGQRTLILVHTALIMDAWLSDLCLLYGDDYRDKIGIIRGPKAFLGTHYTVAMCQTWFKRQQYWKEWFGEFGTMIFDECATSDTKIAVDSGVERCIKDIRVGDFVLSKKEDGTIVRRRVLKTYYNPAPARKIVCLHLSNGNTLRVTANHKLYGVNNVKIAAGDVVVGTILQTVQSENLLLQQTSVLPEMLIHQNAVAKSEVPCLQKNDSHNVINDAYAYGAQSEQHLPTSDDSREHRKDAFTGTDISENSRICATPKTVVSGVERTNKKKYNNKILRVPKTGVAYDTKETTYVERASVPVRTKIFRNVSVHPAASSDDRRTLVSGFSGKQNSRGDRRTFALQAKTEIAGQAEKSVVQETRDNDIPINKFTGVLSVLKVETLSIALPVYNLEVEETHNYFANGVLAANCHLAPAKTFCDCANNCPAKYRIGITGTPKRKDGLHKIMYQVFGTPFYEQKSTGVETETSLPISDAVVIKTKTHLPAYIIKEIKYKVFGKEKTKFVKVPPDGQRDYLLILKTLERAKKRTAGIAKVVASILHTDKYACVLVSSHRRKHAHRLRNAIKKASGMGIALLIGALGNKRTAMYVRKLKARKLRCAVATTQFIKTGASIPPLNHLVITTPIGATQDLEQLSGRIRRKCVNKTFAKIWHVVDWNIPLCKRHFISKAVPLYRDKLHIPRFKNYYAG